MRPVTTNILDLFDGLDYSSLSQTAVKGGSTITVYSVADFAVNKILLIGEIGDEGSEIILTHASTAPNSTTNVITLASNLAKSHPKDTRVYVVPYNQIEFSHADTIDGSKTVLSGTPKDINPENPEIRYNDITYSSGYYFTRYKETIGNTYSEYSDAVPFDGYESNTVGFIIYGVLQELGKEFSSLLTYQTMLNKINSCLRYVRGKLKRWSNSQEFDYIVGQVQRGDYRMALPDIYHDKNSNKSCLSVRVGSGEDLIYIDKREYNARFVDVVHTTVATTQTSGQTTLVLSSSDDLPEEDGTVNVYVSGVPYTITYTTNTKSTNTLSGIPSSGTGSITTTLTAGSNVWYNESEGGIKYFSIWDGYIYWQGLCSESQNGNNLIMDFYTDLVNVDSDSDIIPDNRYDMIEYWLKWEVRNITERKGKRDMTDGDYLMFVSCLQDAIRRESSGQKFKMKPKLNGVFYSSRQTPEEYERT